MLECSLARTVWPVHTEGISVRVFTSSDCVACSHRGDKC